MLVHHCSYHLDFFPVEFGSIESIKEMKQNKSSFVMFALYFNYAIRTTVARR
jgi:hypothetical protein